MSPVKIMKNILPAALIILSAAQLSFAGVEGTHHDMGLFNMIPAEEVDVCSYCHFAGHKIRKDDGFSGGVVEETYIGDIGAFCYACHDGTVVPTALVESPTGELGLTVLENSHGKNVAMLRDVTDGLEGKENVAISGLLEKDPLTDEIEPFIECVDCHDPHSNQFPPFLRAPLGDICQRCHSGADYNGTGRYTLISDTGLENQAHPIGMEVNWSASERRYPEKEVREMSFGTVAPELRVPAESQQSLRSPIVHWSTGGHLDSPGGDEPVGRVSCSTCHSAHSVRENLLTMPMHEINTGYTTLCIGCHGDDGAPENPGGTPYFHPTFSESAMPYDTSNEPKRDLVIEIPGDWPLGGNGELTCNTCHRTHNGRVGKMCIRSVSGEGAETHICNVCHRPDEDNYPENSHHITTAEDVSGVLDGRILSWYENTGGPGDLEDGLMCIDCHKKLSRGAHNW
ncbi:MAG: hypothetical protein C0609_08505 [Deltaproteobacteria bacterium]|nr:MAG: hypothetical protein C0609_08505 [Deltaproteobacteria bacterium]